MKTQPITEDDLREAFMLGFMVTREGFCAEYMHEDHAPTRLQPATGTEVQFREDLLQSPQLVRLRELAVRRIIDVKSSLRAG